MSLPLRSYGRVHDVGGEVVRAIKHWPSEDDLCSCCSACCFGLRTLGPTFGKSLFLIDVWHLNVVANDSKLQARISWVSILIHILIVLSIQRIELFSAVSTCLRTESLSSVSLSLDT